MELIVCPQRFEKFRFRLYTHTRENSVFKKFHSGERFKKVWTEAVPVKKKLRFQMKTDTCGQGLSLLVIMLSLLIITLGRYS